MATRTYPSGIVGLPYPSADGRPCRAVCAALLAPGDTVSLRRDPDNPHDANAIAVFADDVHGRLRHCGWIPARHTAWIGEALDKGQALEATVGDVRFMGGVLEGVDLAIAVTR